MYDCPSRFDGGLLRGLGWYRRYMCNGNQLLFAMGLAPRQAKVRADVTVYLADRTLKLMLADENVWWSSGSLLGDSHRDQCQTTLLAECSSIAARPACNDQSGQIYYCKRRWGSALTVCRRVGESYMCNFLHGMFSCWIFLSLSLSSCISALIRIHPFGCTALLPKLLSRAPFISWLFRMLLDCRHCVRTAMSTFLLYVINPKL